MRQGTRRSLTTMAALALALTVSLSGCATLFGASAARAPHSKAPALPGLPGKAATGAPEVGSCWLAPQNHSSFEPTWSVSDNGGPVKCEKPHQLLTVAVVPLSGSTPNVEYSNGEIDQDVYAAGEQACVDYIKKHIGTPDDQNGRFEYKSYLPVKKDWSKGARWVRCDLTIFKLGSPVAAPELESLPSLATLKREFKSKEFDLCTNVPGGTVADGPRAASAVFASCAGTPQWTFFHYFGDDDPSASYPTPTEFKAQFQQLCAPFGAASGAHVVPWYPTAEQWADGTQGLECWAHD